MEEFNRVLVESGPRSLVLIGGIQDWEIDPAPSSLHTTVSSGNGPMSVERSRPSRLNSRAERLGDIDSEFYLYAETNMQSVRAEVERIQPDFLIIDSIQTIMSP